MSMNKHKKVAFYTLGCRANQYQTEVIKSQVLCPESCVVNFSSPADIYVINTCTVTHDAERKSRQAIRRALRQNPKAKVIVAGCYSKLEEKQLKKIFPSIEIKQFDNLVTKQSNPSPRIRANLMIQNGCEHFCSYCIVPYARGKIWSKPLEQIIQEAQQLVMAGARELILTGINLGTYKTLNSDLSSVLKALNSIPNLLRIRISSIEPMYLTKSLIDAIATLPKVCNSLHIPLQSGDNNILKAMNRNYTINDYLELISYARKKIPLCSIGTDIIVGFPGETENQFQNTVKTIKQINFSRLHIFSYSPRKGTPAATFPNQIDVKTKKRRHKQLQELNQQLMQEFAKQYKDKQVEVLVEQQGEGLTSNFIRCFFDDPTNSSSQLKTISANSISHIGEIRE